MTIEEKKKTIRMLQDEYIHYAEMIKKRYKEEVKALAKQIKTRKMEQIRNILQS